MKILKLFLEDPMSEPNDWNIDCIYSYGVEMAMLYLNHPRVDPSSKNNEPFINACYKKDFLEVFNFLLKDPRVDPSADAIGMGYIAFKMEDETFRALLKDSRLDPSKWAFQYAASWNYFEIFEELLNDPHIYCDRERVARAVAEGAANECTLVMLRDNRTDTKCILAIMDTISNLDIQTAKLVLEDERIANEDLNRHFVNCIYEERMDIAKLLLSHKGVDVVGKSRTAARHMNSRFFERLKSSGNTEMIELIKKERRLRLD